LLSDAFSVVGGFCFSAFCLADTNCASAVECKHNNARTKHAMPRLFFENRLENSFFKIIE